MSKKTALVLSGGGAKGAFQVAAEKHLREKLGYNWDIIAGVSVGALNGVLLAMQRYQRLEEIWMTISNEQVYTGKINRWSLLKLFISKMLGRKSRSIVDNGPLWKMLNQEVDLQKVKVKLKIGTVSLETGEYYRDLPDDPDEFKRAILASTAIPIIWEPVEVSPQYRSMVDGGIRNMSPLGDVLDYDPDEVIIINCTPLEPVKMEKPPADILAVANRSLEIMMTEIFRTDLREFLRINEMVKQAEARKVTLYKQNGKPFKSYNYVLIQPDTHLNDALDFSRQAIANSMQAAAAKIDEVIKQKAAEAKMNNTGEPLSGLPLAA
jgi:NTE family protein